MAVDRDRRMQQRVAGLAFTGIGLMCSYSVANAATLTSSIAELAAAGGADSTEVYVLKLLEDQAMANGDQELLDLFASVTSSEAAARLAGEITPDRSGASVYNVITAQNVFTNTVRKRASDFILGDSARTSLWVSYLGTDSTSYVNSDGSNRFDGYDADSAGFAVGYDRVLSESSMLGVAFSQQSLNSDSRLYNYHLDIESYQASLYGTYEWRDIYFSAQGVVGWNSNTSKRVIGSMVEMADKNEATARFNSQNAGLLLDAQFPVYLGSFTFLPSIFADYTLVKVEGYSENYVREYDKSGKETLAAGSPASLAYDRQEHETLDLGIGLELAHRFTTNVGVFSTQLKLKAQQDVLDNALMTTASLASGGSSFTLQASEADDFYYQSHLDFAWETNTSFSWHLGAQYLWSDSQETTTFYGRGTYSF
ncbi:autotransporter outer membrane beta-barrel domain-containing protein [Photobacterium nomapromontoriensis]|uniref:autotransporter outer membrane beta-barrel domain-containing protein n=1 Tax=Photobacterium nomapromontoriensis TaxID=2910237 RepID=UPI003D12C74A